MESILIYFLSVFCIGLLVGYATCYLQYKKRNRRIREYGSGMQQSYQETFDILTRERKDSQAWNGYLYSRLMQYHETIMDKNKTIQEKEAIALQLRNQIESIDKPHWN